eukprot:scaffold2872_cov112-Isochrysis_galbana.AAC.9
MTAVAAGTPAPDCARAAGRSQQARVAVRSRATAAVALAPDWHQAAGHTQPIAAAVTAARFPRGAPRAAALVLARGCDAAAARVVASVPVAARLSARTG